MSPPIPQTMADRRGPMSWSSTATCQPATDASADSRTTPSAADAASVAGLKFRDLSIVR